MTGCVTCISVNIKLQTFLNTTSDAIKSGKTIAAGVSVIPNIAAHINAYIYLKRITTMGFDDLVHSA